MTWLPATIAVTALGLVWWLGPRWINTNRKKGGKK